MKVILRPLLWFVALIIASSICAAVDIIFVRNGTSALSILIPGVIAVICNQQVRIDKQQTQIDDMKRELEEVKKP